MRETSRSPGSETKILIPDDSCNTEPSQLSFSTPMTASIPPFPSIEVDVEESDRDREKKWSRKSLDEPKTKRRETATSFSNFLHRFTRSDDKKEEKQKPAISHEGGAAIYEWKVDCLEETLLTEFVPSRKELLRVEHSDPELDDLERSMLNLLEEFRSGKMRALTDEQMESMRAMKREHENITNLHLALYNLDKGRCEKSENELDEIAIIAKLFTDMPSIEGLLKIINEIPESDEGAAEKVAEVARKYKDVFEKKPGEVEHFLANCNPKIGSAAMVVAMKSLYDSSIAKNNEQGADRAVEFLKHFIESGNMVAAHLKLVPDIVFPLTRNAVFYCLRKKNEPQIGLDLAVSAMRLLVDPNECVVTSLHSALFAVCVRLNNTDAALPYIYRNVTALANEVRVF
ncbi:unnamed protein product [Nippostrongylus brasiliensis]|uniref:COP9 signalosome complex subunit 3 (inferred by orthology to a C. elegans protein) n=1 Tax=Nippostrongylus brasiliensis TaxID=27835 RepID=A0A0N4YHK1_NIPBR|nr:unnamed protein product [Nippostrongylus brasiliensis]